MILNDFFSAFRAGKELAKAVTWKQAQVLTNALVALLTALVAIAAAFGYKIALDNAGVQSVAAGVVALVGLFNGGVTVATTVRLGLQPEAGDTRGGGNDGSADRGAEGRGGMDPDVHRPLPPILDPHELQVRKPDIWHDRSLG